MRRLAAVLLVALTVVVSAVYLPMLYEKLFFKRIEKTHLLFSPVTKRFIYKEKIVGPIPEEAARTAEDHHAEIAYCDADGTYYTRVDFEKNLPFIYYKNMDLWGLLPLRLCGKEFEKEAIKKNRQVLELKPEDINDRGIQLPLQPLLESNPGQARLVFPEDRFRITDEAMEFINADFNTVDEDLTELFTDALKAEGFVFPARSVNGKFTILKPFDEGVFLVDDEYRVFHVKRRDGRPVVVKTSIDPALKARHIKITENRRREYYGLLLAGDGSLYVLTYDDYRLIQIPLDGYDPDRMDFKLLMNPLYRTAVYSDEAKIRAVAMDENYQPIARYEHRMSRAEKTSAQFVYKAIFPFSLHIDGDRRLSMSLQTGSLFSLIGMFGSLAGFTVWRRVRRRQLPRISEACLVAVTGLYGLIAVNMIDLES